MRDIQELVKPNVFKAQLYGATQEVLKKREAEKLLTSQIFFDDEETKEVRIPVSKDIIEALTKVANEMGLGPERPTIEEVLQLCLIGFVGEANAYMRRELGGIAEILGTLLVGPGDSKEQ